MTAGQRILVTGATGFVGSTLVRRLVQEGHAVRIFRRPSARLEALGGVACEESLGDLTDPAAVQRAVAGCHVVFHAAALIQYWDRYNAIQNQINVEGTRHVAEAAWQHRVQRLIHISSVSAIGYVPDGGLASESTMYNLGPLRLNYADSKYAAEIVVRDAVLRGLDAVIINPGTIYGPGDRRRVHYIRGLAGPCYTSGGMPTVDVEDVVEGAIRAWQRGRTGERYILVGENLSYREVGRIFATCWGRTGPRIWLPGAAVQALAALVRPLMRLRGPRGGLTPAMARVAAIRFYYSNAKARRELGMSFRPFRETAQRTITWLRQVGLL